MSASTPDRTISPNIKTATLRAGARVLVPSRSYTALCNPGRVRDARRFDLGFTGRHALAVPFGCILLLALPCLAVWAAITPALRWQRARSARRFNAAFLRDRR